MMENSSLVLLANVALNRQPKELTQNLQRKEYLRRRELRTKALKVISLDGVDHAEVTDLKCLPIGVLLEMFVEKFDDKRSHCSVYVCKYGQKHSCDTRFIDAKENRINRLEHLVQCHLLEHLTKTRTGSLIKLPKLLSSYEKTIPSTSKPKLYTKPKYEEIDWRSEEEKKAESIVNELSHPIAASQPKIIEMANDIRNDVQDPESVKTIVDSVEMSMRQVKFDHPYSNLREMSNIIPVFSTEAIAVPLEYQSVDRDKLYYLNGESSSELNSFMINETLNKRMQILIGGGQEFIVEQLPLVGSEAEVTTERENVRETVPIEFSSKPNKLDYPCTKCDIVLSSKHIHYLHMKNRHSDSTIFKKKASRKSRTSGAEIKTIKRKLESITEHRDNDFFDIVKENNGESGQKSVKIVEVDASILKTALLKESNSKKPVINISSVWSNFNVQYV